MESDTCSMHHARQSRHTPANASALLRSPSEPDGLCEKTPLACACACACACVPLRAYVIICSVHVYTIFHRGHLVGNTEGH